MGGVNDGVAFANVGAKRGPQDGGTVARGGRRNRADIRCYNCGGGAGHIAWECPHADNGGGNNDGGDETTATQLLVQGMEDLNTEELFQFAQASRRSTPKIVGTT
jgi:hypothetical protein